MRQYIENLRKKSKRQRLMIFWASVVVSFGLVVLISWAVTGLSRSGAAGDLRGEQEISSGGERKAVTLPQIKEYFKNFFGATKDIMESIKNRTDEMSDTLKDALESVEEMEKQQQMLQEKMATASLPFSDLSEATHDAGLPEQN